jgi:hypothetical protein
MMSAGFSRSFHAHDLRGVVMASQAKGTFDVKIAPQPVDAGGDAAIGRMTIDKSYHGDLDGHATGQMLAHMTAVHGSAVYVALERFDGTLHGLRGAFVLHHTGLMTRGTQQLSVTVAPDSGTGELVGLTGTLEIIIADGTHSYRFDYTIGA